MSSLPDAFRFIRLELAREPGHPDGSNATGYELVAPLDEHYRLDPQLWKTHRDRCGVRRFHEHEEDRSGHLGRRPGGTWYFDYDPKSRDDDEAGHKLGGERFVPGEYVSIADEHHKMHAYRIVSVRSL